MFLFLLAHNIVAQNIAFKIYNFYSDGTIKDSVLPLNEKIVKFSLQNSLTCFLKTLNLEQIKNENDDLFIKNMNRELECSINHISKYWIENKKYDEVKKHLLKIKEEVNVENLNAKINSLTHKGFDRNTYQLIAYFDVLIEILIKSCQKRDLFMLKIENFCNIMSEIHYAFISKLIDTKTIIINSSNEHLNISSSLGKIIKCTKTEVHNISCINMHFLIIDLINKNLSDLNNGYCQFLNEIDFVFKNLLSYALYLCKNAKIFKFCFYIDNQKDLFAHYFYKNNHTAIESLPYVLIFKILGDSFDKMILIYYEKIRKNLSVQYNSTEMTTIKTSMKENIGRVLLECGYEFEKQKASDDIELGSLLNTVNNKKNKKNKKVEIVEDITQNKNQVKVKVKKKKNKKMNSSKSEENLSKHDSDTKTLELEDKASVSLGIENIDKEIFLQEKSDSCNDEEFNITNPSIENYSYNNQNQIEFLETYTENKIRFDKKEYVLGSKNPIEDEETKKCKPTQIDILKSSIFNDPKFKQNHCQSKFIDKNINSEVKKEKLPLSKIQEDPLKQKNEMLFVTNKKVVTAKKIVEAKGLMIKNVINIKEQTLHENKVSSISNSQNILTEKDTLYDDKSTLSRNKIHEELQNHNYDDITSEKQQEIVIADQSFQEYKIKNNVTTAEKNCEEQKINRFIGENIDRNHSNIKKEFNKKETIIKNHEYTRRSNLDTNAKFLTSNEYLLKNNRYEKLPNQKKIPGNLFTNIEKKSQKNILYKYEIHPSFIVRKNYRYNNNSYNRENRNIKVDRILDEMNIKNDNASNFNDSFTSRKKTFKNEPNSQNCYKYKSIDFKARNITDSSSKLDGTVSGMANQITASGFLCQEINSHERLNPKMYESSMIKNSILYKSCQNMPKQKDEPVVTEKDFYNSCSLTKTCSNNINMKKADDEERIYKLFPICNELNVFKIEQYLIRE